MIIVNLDVEMAKKKISSIELAEKIGISQANLSILKTNKTKDDKIRNSIGEYINNFKDMWKSKGFQDYNISRSKVNKILKNKIAK